MTKAFLIKYGQLFAPLHYLRSDGLKIQSWPSYSIPREKINNDLQYINIARIIMEKKNLKTKKLEAFGTTSSSA